MSSFAGAADCGCAAHTATASSSTTVTTKTEQTLALRIDSTSPSQISRRQRAYTSHLAIDSHFVADFIDAELAKGKGEERANSS
jgi:hypothetical protein